LPEVNPYRFYSWYIEKAFAISPNEGRIGQNVNVLASGGQAIIDERKAAWEKTFGDTTSLPAK
jgi:hypothetical protein